MSERTVTVKGTVYSKRTGMPLHLERDTLASQAKTAQQVHRSLQKSTTLHRKYVKLAPTKQATKASTPAAHSVPTIDAQHKVVKPQAVTRASGVTHFHQPTASQTTPTRKVIRDIGPAPHASVSKVTRKLAKADTRTVIKPSQIIKQEAISKAMSQVPDKRYRKDVIQPSSSKTRRFAGLASASLAIILLGAYFTYLSMPSLSTRVAAAQAGIDASYPGYQPTGYSLNGPVAYQQGKVTMKFVANAAPTSFTLNQTRSGWDSSAVLDSFVKPNASNGYETTTSNGLTIYTYDGSAAWVNRGIFYTITGDAPLSSDQIQHIATSL